MLPYILLIFGFACLIIAANQLVDGSAVLAKRINVSDLAIGLTVVAFGTSTPELFVNIVSAVKGNLDIAFGNAVGSNIVNILLILGISAIIAPLSASRGTVWKEIPFSLLAAVVLGIAVNDRLFGNTIGDLSRGDGLILLCFFIIFLYYTASIAIDVNDIEQYSKVKMMSLAEAMIRIGIGLAGLMLGGWLVVYSATHIAKSLGMSESFIGLTIVAIGTSLPELATSAMAAFRGNADIAIGNVVGSNIFNIFFILGITSLIRPIPHNENGNLEIILLVAASALLFFVMFTGKSRSLDRWEGFLFLVIYIGYIGFKISLT